MCCASPPPPKPASLLKLAAGASLVLPSMNGASSAMLAAKTNPNVEIAVGCLRNAAAVSGWLAARPASVGVIACGELDDDGSLRPAVEDMLAAGAILATLDRGRSPEAAAAVAAFLDADAHLEAALLESASGRELSGRGMSADAIWAADLDASQTVPVLRDGAFRPAVG